MARIDDLLAGALTAACASYQDAIGQDDGGTAGNYFSGDMVDKFNEVMRPLIEEELRIIEEGDL
jgi:hypothetical protein